MDKSKRFGLLLGPLLFIATLTLWHPDDLGEDGRAVLAATLWIAVWWILEVIPIAATSLLPIVLFPLTGALDIGSTASAYGHKFVFLYLGGFVIAVAIERWGLHKRIALNVIWLIGGNIRTIILGFMCATAFLSMWISNTATSVMMLPIATAIIVQLSDNPATAENENIVFGKALMLAIAYSASIGGIATLIGTPPNLVLAGVIEELYAIEITFAQWLVIGLPITLVLLVICWLYLTRVAFSFGRAAFPAGRREIQMQLQRLGEISRQEKRILVVFSLTALAWISRSFILQKISPAIDDTMIALVGAMALFVIPAGSEKGRALITWDEAVKLPWGVLLLFGGGLALAAGFTQSGLAVWIGSNMTLLEGASLIVLLLACIAMVNFLTEITSNLATTAMILPILAPMALSLDIHPFVLMIGATLAASCAFMLPVATPPNAVVFGSGYLKVGDMVRIGFWMNLISILLVLFAARYLLPLAWGIDTGSFPDSLG